MNHQETINYYGTLSKDSLAFIINDASEAARLGRDCNHSVGKYLDQVHYAAAELARRTKVGKT